VGAGGVWAPAAVEAEAGLLGVVVADAEGHAMIPSRVLDGRVKVWDIIGRSLGVHDASTVGAGAGGVAAVLARSAGVGENLKQVSPSPVHLNLKSYHLLATLPISRQQLNNLRLHLLTFNEPIIR